MKRSKQSSQRQSSDGESTDENEEVDTKTLCEICSSKKNGRKLLTCNSCSDLYHTYCLVPELNNIPSGAWFCTKCVERLKKSRSEKKVIESTKPTTKATTEAIKSSKKLTGPRPSAKVLSPVSVNMEVITSKKRGRELRPPKAIDKRVIATREYLDAIDSKSCKVCDSKKFGNKMLLCDGCDDPYHINCLVPELTRIPDGDWFCDSCVTNKRKKTEFSPTSKQRKSLTSTAAVHGHTVAVQRQTELLPTSEQEKSSTSAGAINPEANASLRVQVSSNHSPWNRSVKNKHKAVHRLTQSLNETQRKEFESSLYASYKRKIAEENQQQRESPSKNRRQNAVSRQVDETSSNNTVGNDQSNIVDETATVITEIVNCVKFFTTSKGYRYQLKNNLIFNGYAGTTVEDVAKHIYGKYGDRWRDNCKLIPQTAERTDATQQRRSSSKDRRQKAVAPTNRTDTTEQDESSVDSRENTLPPTNHTDTAEQDESPVDSREKALQSVLFPTSRTNITQQHAPSSIESREKALQSVLLQVNRQNSSTSTTIIDSREKALQSVLLQTSRTNIPQYPVASVRGTALQSVMSSPSYNNNPQNQPPGSKEKALLSVLFPSSHSTVPQPPSSVTSREKALQSVMSSPNYNNLQNQPPGSKEKALLSVLFPSRHSTVPQPPKAPVIDINREKALQSVSYNYNNFETQASSKEKALLSVLLPSNRSAVPQPPPAPVIDINREKALQSVSIPSRNSSGRPSFTGVPMINQANEANKIVEMYRSVQAASRNPMVQLEAVNSQNDPVIYSRNDSSIPRSNNKERSPTRVSFSSHAPVNTYSTQEDDYDYYSTPMEMELVTSQNDPILSMLQNNAAGTAMSSIPGTASTSVSSSAKNTTPSATKTAVSGVASTSVPSASKNAVPNTANIGTPSATKSAVPSVVSITAPNTSKNVASTSVPSASKNAVPSVVASTSVPSPTKTSASTTSVPSATKGPASAASIPSATKNTVPVAASSSAQSATKSSASAATIPSATKNTVPASTSVLSASKSAASITSVPSPMKTAAPASTSVPSATKNAVPVAASSSAQSATKGAASTTSVPSPTKNAVPASTSVPSATKGAASTTSVPSPMKNTVPASTSVPSATKGAASTTSAPSPTKNAVPGAAATSSTSNPIPTSSSNSLPTYFSSPTKRLWQREDVCSIPYSNFSELKAMLTKSNNDSSVSVMGIVASFSRPKKCSGKNKLMASYSLVDTTSKSASDVVIVNIFGDKIENFPRITAIGDILRLNRVKLGEYKGAPQLVGSKAFNSAFTCFHRNNIYDGTYTPKSLPSTSRIYQSTVSGVQVEVKQRTIRRGGAEKQTEVCIPLSTDWSVSAADFYDENHETREIDYSFNVGDMLKIKALYSFGMDLFIHDPIGDPNAIRTLGSLQQRNANSTDVVKECDFTCMVIRTFVKDGHRYIEVWDGTTTEQITAESIKSISRVDTDLPAHDNSVTLYQAMNKSLHHATIYVDATNEASIAALEPKVNEIPAAVSRRNVLKGTSVLIKFPMVHNALYVPVLNPGVWIRIRYLRQLDAGTMHGQLLVVGYIDDSTHVNLIYPYYKDVTTVASKYVQRAQFEPVVTTQVVVPVRRVVSCDGLPLTPLQFVLAAPSPSKFCTAVRIVRYSPDSILNFVSKTSSLDPSSDKYSPEVVQAIEQLRFNKDYYFQFNLRVADDTAEYDLIAYNKDAEHLLGGITAEKFISNLDTRKMIKERLDQMIAANTIIDVCIRTYESEETIGQRSRMVKRLQVYNTNLISRIK